MPSETMSRPSRKRPREAANVNTDLVAIYEDLANENGELRLIAALRLLSMKFDDDELDKVLKRLFRGLCSSRKAARLGFSVALTEFLAHHAKEGERFSPADVVQILKEQTEPAPGASGQELRDYYFGRLFAAEAVIKSKVLFNDARDQVWESLIMLILDLYRKKQWLREECGWVLQQAASSLQDAKDYPFAKTIFEQIILQNHVKSPEGIALWVSYQKAEKAHLVLPRAVFKNDNPLDESEKGALLAALKGTTTTDEQTNHNNGATWSNKLHYAWPVIFKAAEEQKTKGPEIRPGFQFSGTLFQELWVEFVDGYLFADSASEQRKYWGFLMVQEFVRDNDKPGDLFTSNFLRCFSNQLAKPDRHLHGIASKTLRSLLAAADEDEDGLVAGHMLRELVSADCYIDFDKVTKTKLIERLLARASSLDKSICITHLGERMLNNCGKERTPAQFRTIAADFMLLVAKSWKGSKDIGKDRHDDPDKSTMIEIVRCLTKLAYCKGTQTSRGYVLAKPEVDQQTREVLRSRLLSVLNYLITQAENISEFPVEAADILLNTDKSTQTPPISESEKDIFLAIKRAGKMMYSCEQFCYPPSVYKSKGIKEPLDGGEDYRIYRAFRLLFALSIIQAFSGEPDALDVLEELKTAYQTYREDVKDGEGSFGNVVEIILTLIAKPSVLFRRVGKEVFSAVAGGMDSDDFESMFDILRKSENLAGQQELFNNEAEEDADVEEANSEAESDDASDESEISDEDDEDGEDQEIVEFENKLAQALGTQRVDADITMEDDNDSDEEMMNDEQMAALDPMMSNMFKERKKASSKKENQNAKETIVQFKTKVLELLEIYVQQEIGNADSQHLVLKIVEECIICIHSTKAKNVSEKAASVIKTALNGYKLSAAPEPQDGNRKRAKSFLSNFHDHVTKSGSNLYARSCSQASLLCAKMMLNHGGTIERVWKEYSKTGEKMASSDMKVNASLFQDWFNWLSTAKTTLAKRSASTAETQ